MGIFFTIQSLCIPKITKKMLRKYNVMQTSAILQTIHHGMRKLS